MPTSRQEDSQQESEEAMKKLAETLRARAAAGEDFEKLQDEAAPRPTSRASLPPSWAKCGAPACRRTRREVFNLKAGETSQLITTPNGYLIYKMGEKDTLPLDKVREEIVSTLRSQRMQDAMQSDSAVGHAAVEREVFRGSTGGRSRVRILPDTPQPAEVS